MFALISTAANITSNEFVYYSDMKDRMGVRDRLQDCLDWKDSDSNLSVRPASYGSGRSRSRSGKSYDAAKAESDPNNASICRAMRGFVARKV